jgi:hypothetical protein
VKQSPDLDAIQERMRPGRICLDGFLGMDRRKLVEILEENRAALSAAGADHVELAERMACARDAGWPGLGTPVAFGDGLEVAVETERGKLPCPFGDPGLHGKTVTRVRHARSGQEIVYTDLGIHMLEKHAFLQGRGAVYRIDPRRFARMLRGARG